MIRVMNSFWTMAWKQPYELDVGAADTDQTLAKSFMVRAH
jgi:hypothetical protein